MEELQIQYFKAAELTNKLDLCLRTLNPKNKESNDVISAIYNKLKPILDEITTEHDGDLPKIKSPLYKTVYKVVDSDGKKFKGLTLQKFRGGEFTEDCNRVREQVSFLEDEF